MFLGWVAQGQVCSKKPPASREVLSPGFGMRWDNLWLKPRWILWNLMVKSWFPVDFPLNQSVEAYTSFCARNLMSNSSNVASWWVSLMILQLHYDPYMPCYPGIAVDVDLAKREMWTATHMVALWSWDILDITYIYDYICIYHIVTKEGDSLRLGGSCLAQHYLLDRSFQALTELSLRSGEKKAGAVGMSRVIACHTKEVLMHSKHTWYSYGIHMVFIWYSYGIHMVSNEGERNQDALWNRTGRDSCANAWIIRQDPGELVQPVTAIHLFWFLHFLHCFYNNFYRLGKQTKKLPCCILDFTIAQIWCTCHPPVKHDNGKFPIWFDDVPADTSI